MSTYVIAFFLAITLLGGVYEYGHHVGYEEERLNVQGAIEEANASARMTEQELNGKISDLSTQLSKVQNDAKKQIAQRDADIATGKLQLYVKTAPNSSCSNAPSTSGSDPSYARIDPTFAESLVRITDDGDSAIRKLNACLQIYNQVRTMINGFPNPR